MTTQNELFVRLQRLGRRGRIPEGPRPRRLQEWFWRRGAGAARLVARALRGAAVAAAALEMVVGSALPAWAQRRRAEPEANPQFQQELQTPSGGGSPVGEAAAEPEAAPSPAEEAAPRAVQGVQIGAAAPAKAAPAERVAPLDQRVTVRVKGAPLATFLDTISAQAKVNFIITEGLETKRVTAFLQNVTVREALQVLLEIKGLTYQQIGKSNTYVVTPRSKAVENLITRIYTLAYIPLIALGSSAAEAAAISPITIGGSGGGGGLSGSGGGGSAGGPSGTAAGGDVGILNVLKSVLSRSGQVALEPRTNSLIVTDIPEVFPQVEQIIAELDKKAPQVMIEAQIVEIDSTRTKDLGFEWGGPNGELGSFTAGARDTSFPLQLPRDLGKTRFLDPVSSVVSNLGSGGAASGGASGAATGGAAATLPLFNSSLRTSLLDLTQLKITLRALVSRAEARFLGKPKILTLNNKSAIIQVATSQAVSIQQQQSSVGGGIGTQSQTAERVTTGLILRVTPQVNKEGYITMLIQPTFTDVQEATISTASNKVFDPISRGASTLVRVKNGQTLVLGGLLESTETKVVRKVPFFGYIPIIGWLFTSTSSRRRNSDLVIFITPTIVSD